MAVGLMNKFVTIGKFQKTKDNEGFIGREFKELAIMRAYVEGRHGSKRWANLAQFCDATELFRIRKNKVFEVTTEMTILFENSYFEIISIENVKGRNMYTEILAKRIEKSSG